MNVGSSRRWLAPLATFLGLTIVMAASLGLILLVLGHPPSRGQWSVILLALIAVVLAAVSYTTIRTGLARVLQRWLTGHRSAPDEVLRTFVAGLSRAVPFDETLLRLTETLRETLVLSAAEVWISDAGSLSLAVADPPGPARTLPLGRELEAALIRADVRGEAWMRMRFPEMLAGRSEGPSMVIPVAYSGTLLGLLLIASAPGSRSVTSRELTALVEVCRQLALALHNLRLDLALQASHDALRRSASELRASRARVVGVADAERRKIERDLHDGAQQRLLGAWMRLGMARSGASDERESQLRLAESDLHAAMTELRELAQGIYPPLLADSGLAAALTAACRRAVIPTRVEITLARRYPPAIEAAVYFCCLESLNNATKYAGADATVTLTLAEVHDELAFVVADDGAGFEVPGARGGIGLLSIQDRVGAVAGRVEIRSAPGQGTRVSGTIPLGVDALSALPQRGTAGPPSPVG